MTKLWIAVVVLILAVIAGAWLIMTPGPTAPTDAISETRVFTWNITELGEHPSAPGIPRSVVALTSGGKTYPIGEFDGSCFEIEGTAWTLYEGEKTGVVCWWAGGGSEVGVFEENGKFVVKQGDLDEGTAETPGVRGNFRTILTIE